MTASSKKVLSYIFKAILLASAFIYIYHEYLTRGDDLRQFTSSVANLKEGYVITVLTGVVVLMFVNYWVECLKWQFLTRKLFKLSLWKTIEGVFCGLTWAIFTPNRVGEYGGRVFFLPPRKRALGFFSMIVGGFGQYITTNILGSAALLWFAYKYLHLSLWGYIGFSILAFIFIGLLLVLFFHMGWLVGLLNRIPYIKKYHRFFDVMASYEFDELIKIISFCILRFFIFSFQYYLVIHLLIPELQFYLVMLLVFAVMFIRSVLPSIDVIDIAVRTTVAATVFAYVTPQLVSIVAAFTAIWFINIVAPAILGSVFIFKLKFFDRNV